MPHVQRGQQVVRQGQHTRSDIGKTARPSLARDDLREAFAGSENKGPAKNKKSGSNSSTNVKSRQTEKSKTRTPIR